ncbi:HUWE1 [Branchiostoma lanceolatum]|uniref:E3 ubiquitin-protein ligase HUWE1 n=1 Tax=Branchiostoma lanceolatum TaxID=7740 RepID=A0A8J9ZYT2_BRALA|nr:HUWE1 [Branchiostoma lanceolatum]
MKIDRTKLKKTVSEVPADCKALIEHLKTVPLEELPGVLDSIKTWNYGKCELVHWIDVLDRFDTILEEACLTPPGAEWTLPIDRPDMVQSKERLLKVLQFTALLIEHSFSRHLYNSMEHVTRLLSSSDMGLVLPVLNLLFVCLFVTSVVVPPPARDQTAHVTRLLSSSDMGLVLPVLNLLFHVTRLLSSSDMGLVLPVLNLLFHVTRLLSSSDMGLVLPVLNLLFHVTRLLSSSDMGLVLPVLNLLFVFSKRSNFITRLAAEKRQTLLGRLQHLAESWGGKENGFGLAECCQDLPFTSYPASATTLHFEFYTEVSDEKSTPGKKSVNAVQCIHIENVDKVAQSPAEIMENLLKVYNVPKDKQMLLFTHIRLAYCFSDYRLRLQCVQARLQALSVLVYSAALQDNANTLLYNGLIEELVDVLQLKDTRLTEIKAASLRTLTAIIHLERNPNYLFHDPARLGNIIDATGAASYHGFLPVLVRSCIHAMTAPAESPFPQPFATALFSFLYHLASYEAGGEALVSCGMMESLLKVINWLGDDQDNIIFVTRAVRVVDLITNLDMTSFQTHSGLTCFINRLEHEVEICRKECPFVITPIISAEDGEEEEEHPEEENREGQVATETRNQSEEGAVAMETETAASTSSGSSDVPMEMDGPSPASTSSMSEDTRTETGAKKPGTGLDDPQKQCFPQRAALMKSMLNFLKKAIPDPAFSDSIRHVMDGSLPVSLKHIISNAEYYGPSLFLLATDVVTVYVFQEPSLLSSLQDNGLTDVVLHALLIKDVPATREVLSALPNVFSALCLNQRGLQAFVRCRPFDKLFKVLLSEAYLPAMRRRRSSDTLGDTASNLGNAMDELMRHQPTLRTDATKAIIKLLEQVCAMGQDAKFICTKPDTKATPNNQSPRQPVLEETYSEDEEEEDDVSSTTSQTSASKGQAPELQETKNVGLGVLRSRKLQKLAVENGSEWAGARASPNAGAIFPAAPGGTPVFTAPARKTLESLLDSPGRKFPSDTVAGVLEVVSLIDKSDKAPGTEEARTPIPLLDYVLNVMKFVESILSNNTTDDHCREFVTQKGLVPLLDILGLPNLPIDFPTSPACQAVAGVCKSILTLAHEPQVLKQGLLKLNEVLEALEPLYQPLDPPGGSVLLRELANSAANPDAVLSSRDTPLLHAMAAAHSYILMFVHVCRVGQTDIRSMSVSHWGSDLGQNVLKGLSRLYQSLVWESTVLLSLCTPGALPEDCEFGKADMTKLLPKDDPKSSRSKLDAGKLDADKPGSSAESERTEDAATEMEVSPMEVEDVGLNDADKKLKISPQLAAQIKQIKPLLSASSRLGRALAELFGLLVKLCVGSPVRQRSRQHPQGSTTAPTPAARATAASLTRLLASGLCWEPPPSCPTPKFRLTFFICSVGFTSPMLFDEKKFPYHLMLQKFLSSGGLDALFETFHWTLTHGGKVSLQEGLEHSELPDGSGEFLDAWLMLVEKMVNVKNVLESPHTLPAKPSATAPGFVPFSSVQFLVHVHKAAFKAVMHLWDKKPLKTYGARMSESMLAMFCHVLKGEKTIQERLEKERQGEEAEKEAAQAAAVAAGTEGAAAAPAAAAVTAAAAAPARPREPDFNQAHLQQLIDMGFTREHAVEALTHTTSLEQATEYCLTHPPPIPLAAQELADEIGMSEEDQLSRAIAMSLGANVNPEEEAKKKEEEDKKKREQEEAERDKQKDEEPLDPQLLADFTENLLPGCLRLVDALPDTVYRVCDLLLVAVKRNNAAWRDKMLVDVAGQICSCAVVLLEAAAPLRAGDDRTVQDWSNQLSNLPQAAQLSARAHLFTLLFEDWSNQLSNLPQAAQLSARAHLFTLLFEELRQPCAQVLEDSGLVTSLVSLLETAQQCLSACKDAPTPKWLAPVVLLVDLYQKMAMSSKRRNAITKELESHTWKWFDDRTGRWCNYSASNNATIDQAYRAGEATVRFTAGRRRYIVHFGTMVQINEETANRRPIMLSLPPKDDKDRDNSREEKKTKEKRASAKAFLQKVVGTGAAAAAAAGAEQAETQAADEENTEEKKEAEQKMETDETAAPKEEEKKKEPEKKVPEEPARLIKGLASEQISTLVRACVGLIGIPVDPDTLHAVMRLCLRCTREHQHALQFADLGGTKLLLDLKQSSAFTGFNGLATLLIRHVLEEPNTLRHTMEKAVRGTAAGGTGSNVLGVAAGSLGSREFHYLLRILGPAACRSAEMFRETAWNALRIALPPPSRRGNLASDEEEYNRVLGPNAVQLLKTASSKPFAPPPLEGVIKEVMYDLLNALATQPTETATEGAANTAESDTETGEAVMNFGNETGAQAIRRQNSVTELDGGSEYDSGTYQLSGSDIFVSAPSSRAASTENLDQQGTEPDDKASKDKAAAELKAKAAANRPLMTKSAILKLLAELVRSYASVALQISQYHYTAGQVDGIKEDGTVLAYVLDNLLPTGTDDTDKDTPMLARTLLAAIAASNHSPDAQGLLVQEVKAALSRALALPESSDKHTRVQALVGLIGTMMEACPPTGGFQQHQQAFKSQQQNSMNNMIRIFLRRGLVTDLARIPHSLDLSSPNMATTVNAALKPLETLSRIVNQPSTMVGKSGAKAKEGAPSATGEETGNNQQDTDTETPRTEDGEQGTQEDSQATRGEGEDNEGFAESLEAPVSQESHTNPMQYGGDLDDVIDQLLEGDTEDDILAETLMVSSTRRIQRESTTDSQGLGDSQLTQDSRDGEDTEMASEHSQEDMVVVESGEEDHNDDDDDDGGSSADDSGSEEEDEHDEQEEEEEEEEDGDEEDVEDEGSEMGRTFDIDEYEDDSLFRLQEGDEDLFLQLEEMFSNAGEAYQWGLPSSVRTCTYPLPVAVHDDNAPSMSIAVSHPLMVRHADHSQVAGIVTSSGRVHRLGRTGRGHRHYVPATQTIHVHYSGGTRPQPPAILQRLLGPTAAADVLQLTQQTGRQYARVFIGGDDVRVMAGQDDDIFDDDICGGGGFSDAAPSTGAGLLQNVLTAQNRWAEECRVLDGDGVHHVIAAVKKSILEKLEEHCKKELEERQEKKKKQQEEDDKKKKEKEEEDKKKKEKEAKEKGETVGAEGREGEAMEVGTSESTETSASASTLPGSQSQASIVAEIISAVGGLDSNGLEPAGETAERAPEGSTPSRGEAGSAEAGSTEPAASVPTAVTASPASAPPAPVVARSYNVSVTPSLPFPSDLQQLVAEETARQATEQGSSSRQPVEETTPQVAGFLPAPMETSSSTTSGQDDVTTSTDSSVSISPGAGTDGAGTDAAMPMDTSEAAVGQAAQRQGSADSGTSAGTTATAEGGEGEQAAAQTTDGESSGTTSGADSQPSTSTGTTEGSASSAETPTSEGQGATSTAETAQATPGNEELNSLLGSDVQLPEGVDPSFLAALPEDIRQEVLRTQLGIRRTPPTTQAGNSSGTSSTSTTAPDSVQVSPEFLAALPPEIQEEVLQYERMEQQRLEAQRAAANPEQPVDPAGFIQNLPSSLRQQVLADMDDTVLAVMPPEIAAEARNLRRELEERHRQLMQERLFSAASGSVLSAILRTSGLASRLGGRGIHYIQSALPQHHRNTWRWGTQHNRAATATTANQVRLRGRQLLDHEALACLLVLLFVDEPKLNTSRLHRVLRNLCYHNGTRMWVVHALLSILDRTGDNLSKPLEITDGSEKGSGKKSRPSSSTSQDMAMDTRTSQPSWLSISLDAALGCRANVFQIQKVGGKKHVERHSGAVHIHPQASPIVCRHVMDTLISLAKVFPGHFIPGKAREAGTCSTSSSQTQANKVKETPPPTTASVVTTNRVGSSKTDTDFWDVLVKLDCMSVGRKGKGTAKSHGAGASGSESEQSAESLETSPLGLLLQMLAHPVIRRSSVLTDKLLRLLSLVSIALPEEMKKAEEQAREEAARREENRTDEAATESGAAGGTEAAAAEQRPAEQTATVQSALELVPTATSTPSPTLSRKDTVPLRPTSTSSVFDDSAGRATNIMLEKQLQLAVDILTSHSCSEEGLEDATNVLLQLSRIDNQTRESVLKLLLQGGRQLGHTLCEQIFQLLQEVRDHITRLKQQGASGAEGGMEELASPEEGAAGTSQARQRGVLSNRFDSQMVVVAAPTKVKGGRELQLPSMAQLTAKTSTQSFFLRILKVIIQLREAARRAVKKARDAEKRQALEAEAEAIIEMVGRRERERLQRENSAPAAPGTAAAGASTSNEDQAAPPEASSEDPAGAALGDIIGEAPMDVEQQAAGSAGSAAPVAEETPAQDEEQQAGKKEKEEPDEPELPRLSSQLTLEELWDTLSECLTALSDTTDHHAVLVLQPAVEAFFLVHAAEKEKKAAEQRQSERQRHDSHLSDHAPMSPLPATPADSGTSLGRQESVASVSSVANITGLPHDTQKFLRFAKTHRTVLNQILRQSTQHLADGPFSVLVDHTHILDFDVKRRFFRQELERMDEGIRREDLAVHVRRDHVFEDSFRELHRRTPEELKNRLYIVFEGEEGQDAGGLLREWYLIISREIFNPNYALFTISPGDRVTYRPNPSSHCNPNHLSYFKFVGRVIGKAIYDNKLLECYFTRSFYKHILGKNVKYTDMESEDYQFYQGLTFLLENNIEESGLELTFSTEIQEFGVTEVRDLKQNGRNIVVTEENKHEYVKLVCQLKMTGSIRKQIDAFLEGFYEIIPKRLISIFNEQELELLISGLPNIDLDDLKANSEYHKYQSNSLQIQWFWRALRSYDQADRAKFLQFVTGTSKVPLQGFSHLEGMNGTQKFQIHRDDRSTDRLPSAHTCFNQLDLPPYETYEKLHYMLKIAIQECSEGFGFA